MLIPNNDISILVENLLIQNVLGQTIRDYGPFPSPKPIIITDRELAENPDATIIRLQPEARIRLGVLIDMLRRSDEKQPVFQIGPYELLPDSCVLRQEKTEIRLTEKERDILAMLCRANGRTVDRGDLLVSIWGYVDGIETHTLETHIYRIRQKIENDPAKPRWILTEEGGYRVS